jgi:ABC-type dipeptide/oligopeptide/nickel transport system permease subunit
MSNFYGAGAPPEDPHKRDTEDAQRQNELSTENVEHVPADDGGEHVENAIELKEIEGLSQGRIVFRRFIRHTGAMVSLAVLVLVIILAFSSIGIDALGVTVGGWWKYNYVDPNNIVNGARPTLSLIPQWLGGGGITLGEHPFGQDEVGHDTFAQVMRGMQQSLMILFIVGLVSTAVGTIIGAVAGYFRGRLDALLMRFTDVVIIIPLILLAAIIGHTFSKSGSFLLAVVLGLLIWTSLARLVRGEVLTLREREFVDAAKVAGASSGRIMFRHILPNAIGVIIVSATLTMSAAILLETGLSFLGFGVQFPDVSLGKLISNYQASFNTRPWLFWWPGSFIVIIALTINFIGDGLRDAFDPRQKRLLNRSARAAKSAAREKAANAGA